MSRLKAGRLRHRLSLQYPVRDVDGFVGETKDFQEALEVSASVDVMSGREFFGSEHELAGIRYRITMRRTPDNHVQPDWRAVDVDTGWIYDIHEVLPSHDRAVLVLEASSGTAQP